MSESQSPIICVTCRRPFPDDLTSEDAPKYFAQSPLMPKSDSAHDFVSEARMISWYIKAVSYVFHYKGEEVPEEISEEIFALLEELAREQDRRLDLAHEGINETWRRDHGKDDQVRKAGV
jgi:hypothetical protein